MNKTNQQNLKTRISFNDIQQLEKQILEDKHHQIFEILQRKQKHNLKQELQPIKNQITNDLTQKQKLKTFSNNIGFLSQRQQKLSQNQLIQTSHQQINEEKQSKNLFSNEPQQKQTEQDFYIQQNQKNKIKEQEKQQRINKILKEKLDQKLSTNRSEKEDDRFYQKHLKVFKQLDSYYQGGYKYMQILNPINEQNQIFKNLQQKERVKQAHLQLSQQQQLQQKIKAQENIRNDNKNLPQYYLGDLQSKLYQKQGKQFYQENYMSERQDQSNNYNEEEEDEEEDQEKDSDGDFYKINLKELNSYISPKLKKLKQKQLKQRLNLIKKQEKKLMQQQSIQLNTENNTNIDYNQTDKSLNKNRQSSYIQQSSISNINQIIKTIQSNPQKLKKYDYLKTQMNQLSENDYNEDYDEFYKNTNKFFLENEEKQNKLKQENQLYQKQNKKNQQIYMSEFGGDEIQEKTSESDKENENEDEYQIINPNSYQIPGLQGELLKNVLNQQIEKLKDKKNQNNDKKLSIQNILDVSKQYNIRSSLCLNYIVNGSKEIYKKKIQYLEEQGNNKQKKKKIINTCSSKSQQKPSEIDTTNILTNENTDNHIKNSQSFKSDHKTTYQINNIDNNSEQNKIFSEKRISGPIHRKTKSDINIQSPTKLFQQYNFNNKFKQKQSFLNTIQEFIYDLDEINIQQENIQTKLDKLGSNSSKYFLGVSEYVAPNIESLENIDTDLQKISKRKSKKLLIY